MNPITVNGAEYRVKAKNAGITIKDEKLTAHVKFEHTDSEGNYVPEYDIYYNLIADNSRELQDPRDGQMKPDYTLLSQLQEWKILSVSEAFAAAINDRIEDGTIDYIYELETMIV